MGTISLSFVFGAGMTIWCAFIDDEWRSNHRALVAAGKMVGCVLMLLPVYLLLIGLLPSDLGDSMWPKVSMVLGAALLIGGAIWQFSTHRPTLGEVPGSAAHNSPILAPDNKGIVTSGQSGGTNTVR